MRRVYASLETYTEVHMAGWMRRLVGLLSAALVFVVACSPGAQPAAGPTSAPKGQQGAAPAARSADAEWSQIVEAARQEGRVVIYGAFEQSLQDRYIPAFK